MSHKKDILTWYDPLPEKERWDVQARFWEAIAQRCAASSAVFFYDLMNEPVVPGGKRPDKDWLAEPFAGKHFVQFIALDSQKRPRPDVARQWIQTLTTAIRKHDRRHLITVGLVDWSLERPKKLYSGFAPDKIAPDLDFLCVHIYPERGKVEEDLKTLEGFAVGKPIVIEETFTLKCGLQEWEQFVDASKKHACGWIGFYWGKTPEELRQPKSIGEALLRDWLTAFERRAKALNP